jgi:hypothetical protein
MELSDVDITVFDGERFGRYARREFAWRFHRVSV